MSDALRVLSGSSKDVNINRLKDNLTVISQQNVETFLSEMGIDRDSTLVPLIPGVNDGNPIESIGKDFAHGSFLKAP
jgi:hypothetical protein